MLPLGVGLMQAGKNEDNGPGWPRPADRPHVVEDILLGVVQHLDGNHDDMGLAIEACQILAWIVTWLIDAAQVSRKVRSGASAVGKWYSCEYRVQGLKPWPISASSAPVRYLMSVVLPLCVLPYSHRTGTGIFCRSRSSRS